MSRFLTKGDVTDTLIRATEKASGNGTTHVMVILYTQANGAEDKPGDLAKYTLSVDSSENVTIECANWLCDKVKSWLLREEED
jgi:hypothetical protein